MRHPRQVRREILLADDERSVRSALAALLEEAGYDVRAARNGEEAVALLRERKSDLVLLDVMMPRMDGFRACRAIRETDASTPVLFLTALESDADQVRGLGMGADDYVFKTAPSDVLLARVASAIRRASASNPSGDFSFGSWRVSAARCEMRRGNDERVALGEREVAMLRLFAGSPGEVLSRDWLVTKLWGGDSGVTDNLLSVTIYKLRRKLADEGRFLEHVRGVGYAWRPEMRRGTKKSFRSDIDSASRTPVATSG